MTHTPLSSMCYRRNPHLRHVLMQTREAPLLTQASLLERHKAHWKLLYWWSILRGGYKLSIELKEELHRTESKRGADEELLMSTPLGGMDSVTSSQPDSWLWRILSIREVHPSPDFHCLVMIDWIIAHVTELRLQPLCTQRFSLPIAGGASMSHFDKLLGVVKGPAMNNRDTPITWEILRG